MLLNLATTQACTSFSAQSATCALWRRCESKHTSSRCTHRRFSNAINVLFRPPPPMTSTGTGWRTPTWSHSNAKSATTAPAKSRISPSTLPVSIVRTKSIAAICVTTAPRIPRIWWATKNLIACCEISLAPSATIEPSTAPISRCIWPTSIWNRGRTLVPKTVAGTEPSPSHFFATTCECTPTNAPSPVRIAIPSSKLKACSAGTKKPHILSRGNSARKIQITKELLDDDAYYLSKCLLYRLVCVIFNKFRINLLKNNLFYNQNYLFRFV